MIKGKKLIILVGLGALVFWILDKAKGTSKTVGESVLDRLSGLSRIVQKPGGEFVTGVSKFPNLPVGSVIIKPSEASVKDAVSDVAQSADLSLPEVVEVSNEVQATQSLADDFAQIVAPPVTVPRQVGDLKHISLKDRLRRYIDAGGLQF